MPSDLLQLHKVEFNQSGGNQGGRDALVEYEKYDLCISCVRHVTNDIATALWPSMASTKIWSKLGLIQKRRFSGFGTCFPKLSR
jgi:hypothetical protein